MKRFLTWVLALPIGMVVVALAVANRRPVTLSLDPFRPDDPAIAVTLPLFLPILGAVVLGVLLGGVAVWLGQGKHRKAARAGRRATTRLEAERATLAAEVAKHAGGGEAAVAALPKPGAEAA
ncbi:MAG: DUF1049 domain-containing protein [Phyllobacteriaceae bacterium]|nr:DUF1049 domain-containing protein [Phyllobacteriaceae bacterium]